MVIFSLTAILSVLAAVVGIVSALYIVGLVSEFLRDPVVLTTIIIILGAVIIIKVKPLIESARNMLGR